MQTDFYSFILAINGKTMRKIRTIQTRKFVAGNGYLRTKADLVCDGYTV